MNVRLGVLLLAAFRVQVHAQGAVPVSASASADSPTRFDTRFIVRDSAARRAILDTLAMHSGRTVAPYVSVGNTHGYGGTDYYMRVGSTVTAGVDVSVKWIGDNQFLVGAGLTHRSYPQDFTAICYTGIRRTCVLGFPEFNSAQIDLMWRRSFRRIDADFAVRPTLLRNDSGDIPTGNWLGAAAAISVSRPVWHAWSVSLSTSGTYVSSYGGERIGLHENAIGLRLR